MTPAALRRGQGMRRRAATDWGLHLAVAAISLGVALVAIQPWQADLTAPLSDCCDAIAVAAHFKTTLETGWYEFNPLLAAPWGQQYHDFPTAENTNFLIATLLGHLLGNWALAMNAYFLLGFPLAGIAASWFIRVAGASRMTTLGTAPLFALLPYHFVQGEPHLFVASYFVVPLSMVLVLRAARGEPLWGWRDTAHPVGRWFGRGMQTTAIAALTGSTDTYYAVFAILLLAAAGIVAVVRDRDARRFSGAVAAGVLVVAVMALNMLPDWIHAWANGADAGGLVREPEAAETFALKLAQLLLPWDGHQITPLAQLRELYDANYPLASEHPAIGVVAAVGLLLLLGTVVARAAGVLRGRASTPRSRTLGALGGLALVAFLLGTVGGVDSLVSLVTAVLRSWNRIAVVIALLALAAVALLLDAWLERLARRDPNPELSWRMGGAAFAIILIGVGTIDQTPGGAASGYPAVDARFAAYDAYFGGIEASLKPGDWVIQLPNQQFPEATTATGTWTNDVLIPYLHTSGIGWTGGGIRGRPEADWTLVLQEYPADEVAGLAAASGASGILVDEWAVGAADRPLVDELGARLGAPRLSDDGRFAYWSLANEAALVEGRFGAERLAAFREAITLPVAIEELGPFTRGWDGDGGRVSTSTTAQPYFDLVDARDVPADVDLVLAFGGAGDLVLDLPGGEVEVPAGAAVEQRVTVPPGTTRVTIRAADGSPLPERGLTMRWSALDPELVAAFAP